MKKPPRINVNARTTDPETSHEAAKELRQDQPRLARSVATAVKILHDAGMALTDFQIRERWPSYWEGPFSDSLPCKARKWARDQGLVKKAGVAKHHGRNVLCWTLGREDATPPPAPSAERGEAWHMGHGVGYRQGVEDAAREAYDHRRACSKDTDAWWACDGIANRIRALAPAPGAAPREVYPRCEVCGCSTFAHEEGCPVVDSPNGARCEHDIPLTMRCAWCEHAEARRSSPTDVTNVGCGSCGGTGRLFKSGRVERCPACGGRGHA